MKRYYTTFFNKQVALPFNGESEPQSWGSLAGSFRCPSWFSRDRWAVPSLPGAMGSSHTNLHFDANEAVMSEQPGTSRMVNAVQVQVGPTRMRSPQGPKEVVVRVAMFPKTGPIVVHPPLPSMVKTPRLFSQPTQSYIGSLGYRIDPLFLRAIGTMPIVNTTRTLPTGSLFRDPVPVQHILHEQEPDPLHPPPPFH